MSFRSRYLAAFVLGTAAVWFLAPMLQERFRRDIEDGDFFSQEDEWADEVSERRLAAPPPGASFGGVKRLDFSKSVALRKVQNFPRSEQGGSEVAANPDNPGNPDTSNNPVNLQGMAAQVAPDGTIAAEYSEIMAGQPLSLDSIPASPCKPIRWSVLSVDSPLFTKEGKRFEKKVPGGTLCEIEKISFTSKREEMALSHLWNGEKWIGPVLLPTRALVMFEGTREGLAAEDVENLMEYCSINASLARRRAEIEREAVDANPYAAKLRELAEQNKAFSKQSAALVKERDAATGARRNAIADELRKIEIQVSKLNRELSEQVTLYNNWKAAHPAKIVNYTDDSKWKELEERLRDASAGIEMFDLQDVPDEELPDF